MSNSSYSILIQLSRFLLKYKGTLVAAGCALIFTAGITLAMGQGIKILIDDGFVAGSTEQLNKAT
ncbi:MAG: ATP-binding cassette subfamily B protein, partial [Cocleimonas sp.]